MRAEEILPEAPTTAGSITGAAPDGDAGGRTEMMRVLVESASDIISIVDRDGVIRYSSGVSKRMLGYEEGSAPGMTIFDIVHPDDLVEVRRRWEEELSRPGFVRPIEVRLLRADGEWLHTEVIANNLLEDPVVHGVVLTTRDVSEREAAAKELARRDDRFRALVQNLAEAIVVIGADGEVTFSTPAVTAMFGDQELSETGVEIDRFADQVHPADLEAAAVAVRAAREEPGRVTQIEVRVRRSDRRWVRVDALVQSLVDDPSVAGVVITMHDVTERRNAEELNVHQARILELVARGVGLDETLGAVASAVAEVDDGLRCAICVLDEDGSTLSPMTALSSPRSFLQAPAGRHLDNEDCPLGRSLEAGVSAHVPDVEADERCAGCPGLASEGGPGACWSTPLFTATEGKNLGALVLSAEVAGPPTPSQERLMSVFANLAAIAIERKRFEDRLMHQSLHDPLTGLPNRTLFLDRIGHALDRGGRTGSQVGVLFVDLDRFKLVNDSLGHDAGDELLVAVGQRLIGAVRPGDTVARLGGDEFTVLCEDLAIQSAGERAAQIAERFLGALAEPFPLRDTEVFLSASIGIAIAQCSDARSDDILRDADAAMYHAKEQGKGRWELFDAAMRARVLARSETENALHGAIERGELRLFFQPVISLADQRCTGAEALVRWQHPERGLLLPVAFIALAEETGFIHDLGRWVLQEAATQAARWQIDAPDDFTVSVNVSAHQLAQSGFEEIVADVLRRSGVRPDHMCLEITESVLMDDPESTLGLMDRLRGLGVRFSLDDFGTGYSSLGYLRQFPVDEVKIDRSFVRDVTSDPGDAAIVSAIAGLAHALDLEVVAEGVETLEQLTEVVNLGCDRAQGFYFSPPQPVADLKRIFARNRWRTPPRS